MIYRYSCKNIHQYIQYIRKIQVPIYPSKPIFPTLSTVDHWTVVEQILIYLKGALGRGILYSNHGHNKLECFTDADWAKSLKDRRSTLGYYIFVGRNLVLWKSKKQSVVSRSSVESECRAMTQSVCEIM